ncbi:MAG: hypothetical protein JOZ70_11615 [Pseudolabrys sp.]|nr:hypothetical protein [Pseudolabrys sp.]
MARHFNIALSAFAALALTAGAAAAKYSPYSEHPVEAPALTAPIEMRAQNEAAPERTYFEMPGARFRPQLPCRFNRITDRFWNKAVACN